MKYVVLAAVLFTGLSLPAWADTRYDMRVDGLACPYCAYGIEKKLKRLDGVNKETLSVKLNEGRISFTLLRENEITDSALQELVNDSGFTLRGVEKQELPEHGEK